MTLFALTYGLNRDDQPEARAAAGTHVGQAHYAGSGPTGRTCRECVRWQFVKAWGANGGPPKPSKCAKYHDLMREWGRPVPHSAWACRYFEPRDPPVPMVKPEKVV